MRKRDPMTDPTLLGNILIKISTLTHFQLSQAALHKHENADQLLGEICVQLGFINQQTLDIALEEQARMKGGAAGLASLAIERTRRLVTKIDQMTQASQALAARLSES